MSLFHRFRFFNVCVVSLCLLRCMCVYMWSGCVLIQMLVALCVCFVWFVVYRVVVTFVFEIVAAFVFSCVCCVL